MDKTKLVVFDWDGTLFNSIDQIVSSLQFAAKQYDQPLSYADGKDVIGLGLPEVMQHLFPAVPHLHEKLLESYATHYVEYSKNDLWFDGVAEMLSDLRKKGVLLAVATGKSRRGLDRVLEKTQSTGIFEITRAASETKSKPDPLMLQEILNHTGLSAHEGIMVGDTSYDLQMARNMGMPSIGVTYGVHAKDILLKHSPLVTVDNIKELHQALLKYI